MKLKNSLHILIIIISLTAIVCDVVPIFYEKIEQCVSDDERANFIDFSDFKIHVENDTHSYINGTWKFLQEVKSPWPFTMFTEKNTRGQWIVEVFNRKLPDMCVELHNPAAPWYYVFKDVSGCPLSAGTEWFFNMKLLELPSSIPSNFAGKWRYIQSMDFIVNGVTKRECTRMYLDLFEE